MPEIETKSEDKELAKARKATRSAEEERDEVRKTLRDRERVIADHNAIMKRLERELGLGTESPMDWGGPKTAEAFVERVLSAFKSRGSSDLSLRQAHDKLMKQTEQLQKDCEQLRKSEIGARQVVEDYKKAEAEARKELGFSKDAHLATCNARDNFNKTINAIREITGVHGFVGADEDLPAWLTARLAATASEPDDEVTRVAVGRDTEVRQVFANGCNIHVHLHLKD